MKYKSPIVDFRFGFLHPKMKECARDMAEYCKDEFGIEMVITCTVSLPKEDLAVGRVHKGHQQRRCIDVRVNDWQQPWIHKFRDHFNEKYKDIGAVSASSGHRSFIVIHGEGANVHAHAQLDTTHSLPPIEEPNE